MKPKTLLILLAASCALAQTTPAVAVPVTTTAVATTTVNTAGLPSYTFGSGVSWTRGGTTPYSLDTTFAIHIGQGQWYSWTAVTTPLAKSVPGAPPVPSTITTGGAWIPAQSPTGSLSLVLIVQGGFSNVVATSTIAPAFTGSVGLAIRVKKTHWYIMPYAKAANASSATSSGSLATAVFQPGVQVLYGFGGK
jgi:hypothetical protein